MHRIADLRETRLALEDDQFFPGWTILALNRHAAELHEMDESERTRVMEDVNAAARADHIAKIRARLIYPNVGALAGAATPLVDRVELKTRAML